MPKFKVLPTLDGYINESGYLNLARFEKFLKQLSLNDKDSFMEKAEDEQFLESKRIQNQPKIQNPQAISKKPKGSSMEEEEELVPFESSDVEEEEEGEGEEDSDEKDEDAAFVSDDEEDEFEEEDEKEEIEEESEVSIFFGFSKKNSGNSRRLLKDSGACAFQKLWKNFSKIEKNFSNCMKKPREVPKLLKIEKFL